MKSENLRQMHELLDTESDSSEIDFSTIAKFLKGYRDIVKCTNFYRFSDEISPLKSPQNSPQFKNDCKILDKLILLLTKYQNSPEKIDDILSRDPNISPEDFAQKMERFSNLASIQARHVRMDTLMLDLLTELGYKKGVDIFMNTEMIY